MAGKKTIKVREHMRSAPKRSNGGSSRSQWARTLLVGGAVVLVVTLAAR